MLKENIQSAITQTGVSASILDQVELEGLRRTIEGKFADSQKALPLWERFRDSVGKRRCDGWEKVCEFAANSEVILFFDESEEVSVWRFSTGPALRKVLAECPAMEFYVTNTNADYVLCHNHHDFIVGVGSCKQWIEALPED
jgi:hypothetical protein